MTVIGVIYRIVCKTNGGDYIGMTIDLPNRIDSHFRLLKRGRHSYSGLQSDFNLYGVDAFKIELLFKKEYSDKQSARTELRKKESEFIIVMNPRYNPRKSSGTPKHIMDNLILSKDLFEVSELTK